MSIRGIAFHCVFAGFFVLLSLFITGCERNTEDKHSKPFRNVVVLIGDDHTVSALGCYGNQVIRTPSLDHLASEGILFVNAYATAPVCSASRQSILTGKYPHATGVTLLQSPFRQEGNTTLAEILRAHDFKTAIIGKNHFNNYRDPTPPDHGFDIIWTHHDYRLWFAAHGRKVADTIQVRPPWKPFMDSARIWLNADYLPSPFFEGEGDADIDARKAIQFMEENKDNRFLLWVGFAEPHSPFEFPVEYKNRYNPDSLKLPEGSPEDDRWVPAIFRDLSDKDKRGIIVSYYTSVDYLDYNVGKILHALDSLHLSENTLVFYLGDQGYLLNDHKRFEKHMMWEDAIKAPLLIRMGKTGNNGQKITALTSFVDIAPTILELLGMPPCREMQGNSFVPVLMGKKKEYRKYVFAEFLEDNKAMLATHNWKYIYTTGKKDLGQGYATGYGPSGRVQRLYDLKKDPGESHNVFNDPENNSIEQKLRTQMLDLFLSTYPKSCTLPADLTQLEMLDWFCVPPEKRF